MKSQVLAVFALMCLNGCTQSATEPLGTSEEVPTMSMSAGDLVSYFGGDVSKLLECSRKSKRAVIVAHRGGFAPGFPENSYEAIDRTISSSPTVLEIDVVASRDGVDFLHHDDILDRTTNGSGLVESYDWEDLRKLNLRDNGYGVTPSVPLRFDDFLAEFGDRAFWMLDLKAPTSTPSLVEQVRDANILDATIFIVYNHDQAREVLSVASDAHIALGASSAEQLEKTVSEGLSNKPYVALTGPIDANAEVLPTLKEQGHFVLGGTYIGPNPPDARLSTDANIPEFDRAGEFGYQLIVSNRPQLAYDYLDEKSGVLDLSACER